MVNRTKAFFLTAAGLVVVALFLGPKIPALVQLPRLAPGDVQGVVTRSSGPLTLKAQLSHPYVVNQTSQVTAAIDLEADTLNDDTRRTPLNLALVIDRSGSMAGEKIYQAKKAASELLSRLTAIDHVAIIHYGSDVRVFTSALATPGAKAAMQSFINAIAEEGGTNIEAGLAAGRQELARYFTANGVNRLILMSDGQPTEGATEPQVLLSNVRAMRSAGITVSAIGVGLDFNEDLMAGFANVGAGGYAFLSDPARMGEVFEKDLNRAAKTIVRNVRLTIRNRPGVAVSLVSPSAKISSTGETVVELPDFAEGETQRVLVTWQATAGAVGAEFSLADIEVRAEGAASLARESIQIAYTPWARVTDDAALVERSISPEVTLSAARANQAREVELAANALKAGDLAESRRYLARGKQAFSEAARVAGPEAVKADLKALRETEDDFSRSYSEGDVGLATKKAKSNARIGAGLGTSTY